MSVRQTSALTRDAQAFVASRATRALELGHRLADEIDDPEAFATALRRGFSDLADPVYRDAQAWIAPGVGPVIGVRWPLIQAVQRGLDAELHGVPSGRLLFVADRLLRQPTSELRWFALHLLRRILADDPERSWQLMRRVSREASDWITVDSLAQVFGDGILREPYRWAELEQLAYSPSRWERRLVGSTVATVPFIDRARGRRPEVAARGLGLIGNLIGDAEPDVQKALAWALRSLTLVDLGGVIAFCREQAERAAETDDGARAWVIRDGLGKLDAAVAGPLRDRLAGIRRRRAAPSTSEASAAALQFNRLPTATSLADPPLT